MDETFPAKAIVLSRRPFRENDTRVSLYSLERGKLELVARGTRKLQSKLAGHLEPLSLSAIMAVRGRQFDYVGGAAAIDCFSGLKNDLDALIAAGRAVRTVDRLVKPGIEDRRIFELLYGFLETLNRRNSNTPESELLAYVFMLKLLASLGYRPVLDHCAACGKEVDGGYFDPAAGGMVCRSCEDGRSGHGLNISSECANLLGSVCCVNSSITDGSGAGLEPALIAEIGKTVCSFANYTTGERF